MQTLGYFWLLICAELVFGENNCCDNDKDAITANNGQIYCIKDLSKVNAALFACPNGGMILDSYKVLDDNVVDIFGRVFKTFCTGKMIYFDNVGYHMKPSAFGCNHDSDGTFITRETMDIFIQSLLVLLCLFTTIFVFMSRKLNIFEMAFGFHLVLFTFSQMITVFEIFDMRNYIYTLNISYEAAKFIVFQCMLFFIFLTAFFLRLQFGSNTAFNAYYESMKKFLFITFACMLALMVVYIWENCSAKNSISDFEMNKNIYKYNQISSRGDQYNLMTVYPLILIWSMNLFLFIKYFILNIWNARSESYKNKFIYCNYMIITMGLNYVVDIVWFLFQINRNSTWHILKNVFLMFWCLMTLLKARHSKLLNAHNICVKPEPQNRDFEPEEGEDNDVQLHDLDGTMEGSSSRNTSISRTETIPCEPCHM